MRTHTMTIIKNVYSVMCTMYSNHVRIVRWILCDHPMNAYAVQTPGMLCQSDPQFVVNARNRESRLP